MQIISTEKEYTYDIFIEDAKALKRAYSFLKIKNLGYSVLGKSIPFFRFGEGEKKIIITGAHHGKEWITAMLTMALLETFCDMYQNKKRWGEKDAEHLFKTRSFFFVPMVNPDGVNLSVLGLTDDIPVFLRSRLIGMNGGSRDFVGKWQSNIHGVDLNHNYDALFEKGRTMAFASGVYGPCSSRYSGEHPESEPETKAIVSLTREINPDIVIAYHAQGEEIFYKFNGKMARGAEDIAKMLSEKTGYRLIEADGLTDCSGYKDWVIETFQIPAFTIEVGKGENPLPLTQFEKIYADNLSAILNL